MKTEPKLNELKCAEDLFRFEASISIGQTATFLIATATLMAAYFQYIDQLGTLNKVLLTLFGTIMSYSYLVVIKRSSINSGHAKRRAKELSVELGYALYTTNYLAQRQTFVNGRNMFQLLCFVGCFIWIILFVINLFDFILS